MVSSCVPHDLHSQYLTRGKEKLLLKYILCLRPLARNCTRQILRWNHQVNEPQLPCSLKSAKGTGKLKEKGHTSLLWKISLPSSDIQKHKTRSQGEMKQTRSTTKQDFSGEALSKTKHRGLTSLAFMELVPGADRVVRHICIRCILQKS